MSSSLGVFVASNTACTVALGNSVDQCTTNADCSHFGSTYFCRKSDTTCQQLVTKECPYVYGNYNGAGSDNAVYFGVIISLTGPYGDGYKPFEAAVRTAIADFDQNTHGLPPIGASNGQPRPLVGIICDDASAAEADSATTLLSARHLVNDVGVSAIIGTPSTSTTLAMATEVTIPSGVFAISPSATGESITDIADNGLLWRTAPSDLFQGGAMATFVNTVLIPKVRNRNPSNPVPAGGLSILSFVRGDVYGNGLAGVFKDTDAFRNGIGKENYHELNYGTDANAPLNTDVQQQLRLFKPDIILAFGLAETANNVVGQAESAWDAATGRTQRPYYVSGDGISNGDVKSLVTNNTHGLQQRL
ncbi:MAG TPA: ABC transporter substrate-binding protein, partial [Polyangiaceae bacterium]|nr:ABC transporter substrate-binding protein [Polyangiaceae bacterium]